MIKSKNFRQTNTRDWTTSNNLNELEQTRTSDITGCRALIFFLRTEQTTLQTALCWLTENDYDNDWLELSLIWKLNLKIQLENSTFYYIFILPPGFRVSLYPTYIDTNSQRIWLERERDVSYFTYECLFIGDTWS